VGVSCVRWAPSCSDLKTKLQLATEVKDSIEIVHTAEYSNFLKLYLPHFSRLLSEVPPQKTENTEHKLRNVLLEIINRLPHNEVRYCSTYTRNIYRPAHPKQLKCDIGGAARGGEKRPPPEPPSADALPGATGFALRKEKPLPRWFVRLGPYDGLGWGGYLEGLLLAVFLPGGLCSARG
jgi:hypothetical protein